MAKPALWFIVGQPETSLQPPGTSSLLSLIIPKVGGRNNGQPTRKGRKGRRGPGQANCSGEEGGEESDCVPAHDGPAPCR